MWTRGLRLKRYIEFNWKMQNDQLVIESEIILEVNGYQLATFTSIPKNEKELILGFLISEGYITKKEDITSWEKQQNTTQLTLQQTGDPRLFRRTEIPAITSNVKINKSHVYRLTAFWQEQALLFKDTAITDSAVLATEDRILFLAEDIGRLNAVDKVLGLALATGIDWSTTVLLTSGKIDAALVLKAARLGLPCIISRTAPTDRAFDYANNKNICLIGFARGRRFNLYTMDSRLTG